MQKRTKRTLITVIFILVGFVGFYQLVHMFAPGSYPFAEVYELNAPEKNVIDAVSQFKLEDPEFIVPNVTINNQPAGNLRECEGRKDNSYWYFIYFYYPKENQIVFTWTKPKGIDKTSFAFVSLNYGLDLGHWKDINDDFNFFENRKIKRTFEERILNRIEANIAKQSSK